MIPDLNGNNRLDTLRNVIETGEIGLMFVVPGLGETLRVNGRAAVTIDPEVLDTFVDDLRRPTSAIGVTITEADNSTAPRHSAGAAWNPESWPARATGRRPVRSSSATPASTA